MSHRRDSGHSYDDDPLDKRRSDIWKRFGFNHSDEERPNMFFEVNPPPWSDIPNRMHRNNHFDDPEWKTRPIFNEPGSSSPSFTRRMRMGSKWAGEDETGIPIRVVHEQTPPRSGDDGTDSETSSQASHGSRGSSGGQPMKAKITREPRVHHIPIMVEPRDGSTSSGYASDSCANTANKTTVEGAVQEQQDVRKRSYPTETTEPNREDYQPPNVQQLRTNFEKSESDPSKKEVREEFSPNVHTIPIKVVAEEKNVHKTHSAPARSFSDNSFSNNNPAAPSRQRKASSHPPTSPSATNGPHISKIPVNKTLPKEESPPAEEVKKTKADPLAQIAVVLSDSEQLRKEVDKFEGSSPQDKRYRYLDEMLTRLILKLDNVDTQGKEDIRQARKAAVKDIQDCINFLESKLHRALPKEDDSMEEEATKETVERRNSEEQMQVDPESQQNVEKAGDPDREMQDDGEQNQRQSNEVTVAPESSTKSEK